jgi:acetyl/propionyl-CoA carboxylase alpha subunit
MGVRTIAVYSDVDVGARHVRLADEAVHIGAAEAAKSYLDIGKIIAAAKQSGAEAIHPGYGFLSENPEFAEACVTAGIIFVGPSASSMRQMAMKDQAKKLMESSGVPVTPGYHGDDQDDQVLADAATHIGFPVLIKAVAGGGGRGMRKVETADEFAEQLQSARRESSSAFGNDKMLIEKFISNPRHIEVQVFGDSHGNAVHFFERDCSVQRRHQKVVEEAPAPGMSAAMRKAMCDAAVKAAKAVNYVNAGTVEFIVDGSGSLDPEKFWFMEMNTRLQVEHPVSEAITGYDLVKLQLEVAAGGVLPKQSEIKLSGHAIEVRLYAEQPDNGFLPSTGKLQVFTGFDGDNVRVDTGYEVGGTVSEYYDPMLAKIIVHSADRKQSINDLAAAMAKIQSWPVKINARFLRQILQNKEFIQAEHNTGFIEKYIAEFQQDNIALPVIAAMAAVHNAADITGGNSSAEPWQQSDGWRLNSNSKIIKRLQIGDDILDTCLTEIDGVWEVAVDRVNINLDTAFSDAEMLTTQSGEQVLFVGGGAYKVCEPDAGEDQQQAAALDTINAPMPGKVLLVHCKAGDEVVAGDVLLVMEAMKMEHALKAPRDGVVAAVGFVKGQQAGDGDVLVRLETV